jgi:hypothetical protein
MHFVDPVSLRWTLFVLRALLKVLLLYMEMMK